MAIYNGKEILLAGLKGDSCFIRYSANADGTDFTETKSEGQNYIGIASGPTAPTDKSGYAWYLLNDPNSIQEIQDLLGSWLLTTDADTITGAIAEHEMDILGLNAGVTSHEDRLNVLDPRGTASGRCVVRLDDGSPYRGDVAVVLSGSGVGAGSEVNVYGKNMLSDNVYDVANWVRIDSIQNNSTYSACYLLDEIPNGTYTISARATSSNVYLYFFYSTNGGVTWNAYKGANGTHYIIAAKTSYSITFEKTDSTKFLIWNHNKNDLGDIEYIQIEAGSSATDYAPYRAPVTYTTDAEGKVNIPYLAPTMTLTAACPHTISAYYAMSTFVEATVADLAHKVERNESRVSRVEDYLGIESEIKLITVEGTNETVPVPEGAFPNALLVEIHGQQADDAPNEMGYSNFVPNYPAKITRDDGTVLFEMPSDILTRLDDFGYAENYIYFDDDGKAWYHQAAKVEGYHYTLANGETMIDSVYDGGTLIRMVSPIVTDISDYITFDGVISVEGCTQINVEMLVPQSDSVTDWGVGKTKFVFQT